MEHYEMPSKEYLMVQDVNQHLASSNLIGSCHIGFKFYYHPRKYMQSDPQHTSVVNLNEGGDLIFKSGFLNLTSSQELILVIVNCRRQQPQWLENCKAAQTIRTTSFL